MKPVPDDLTTLVRDLGISAPQLRKLQEEHGEKLVRQLQRRWRKIQEHPRFLSTGPSAATEKKRQSLKDTPPELGYSASTFNAIDPLEALSKEDQDRQSDAAREAWDGYVSKHRPKEKLRQDLRTRSDRVRRLKGEAIRKGIDVRAEFDRFISELEARLAVPAEEAA